MSEPTDLAEVLLQFTNLIMNERVKSYNEGLDAERERCAKIAETFSNQGRDGHQIAKEIRQDYPDEPTESIKRGAELLRSMYQRC